jgi:tetratricopeptide (TPR) repeat protein
MELLKILLIILAISLTQGCIEISKERDDMESTNLLGEFELLSGYRNEIPEVVTEDDIEKCEQAVSMARAISNEEIELICLARLIELQNKSENFKDALATGKEALALANMSDDDKTLANIYRLIGRNYYDMVIFHKAFENLEIALKLFQNMNDTVNIQDVMNLQGSIYLSYNDYEMAFSYYNQNLELSRAREDDVSIAKALTNIGLIYYDITGDTTLTMDSVDILKNLAIEYISNALLYNKKTNDRQNTAGILLNLADIHRSNGDYDEALKAVKEALIFSDGSSKRAHTWLNISYAYILYEMDSIDVAEKILLEALDLAEENELKESLIDIYNLLSHIYISKGNYELVHNCYTNYSYLLRSTYKIDYKKQIDAIKMASELEAEENLHSIERQQRNQKIFLMSFLLVSVFTLIILLYYRLRQRHTIINLENELLNERLETRNRELALRIMALIQKNEIDKDIVQRLNSLKLKLKKECLGEVQDILRSFSFKKNDMLWKEFEIRFESVHQDFFTKLSTAYPVITTNEKRLCAFLYLDMSSKDISAVTGQSIRALNVARTRLRKRFNITNDGQSISGFLNSL